jgi:hypothetical protein
MPGTAEEEGGKGGENEEKSGEGRLELKVKQRHFFTQWIQ